MSGYAIILYLHVLGAIGYGAGTLISLLGQASLQRVQKVEQARALLGLLELVGPVSGISLLVTFLAGLYMTITNWGWGTGWIEITLGSMVLLFVFGAMMGTRRHALALMVRDIPDGPLSPEVERRINDHWMGMGIDMLVTLLLGIIFLMTAKPSLLVSLIVIGISLLLGLLLRLINRGRALKAEIR